MEPNKIDKQFKEKLDVREIQPSAQAWDRLDAMLTVAEEKKTRRPYGFLFIAASILVFVTLGLFFFTQNNTEIKPSTTVVEAEIKKDTVQNLSKTIQNQITKNINQNEVVASSENKSATDKRQPTIKESIINQKTDENQSQINKDKEIEYMLSGDIAVKEIPKINYSTEPAIVRTGSNIKSDEALIADLDKVAKQSSGQKAVVKVDAKSLLYQADGEVEYTFREKIINRVNKNYREVKVALANRNNRE